jgi:predicted transcriptional regulator
VNEPQGTLTGIQLKIMKLVWEKGDTGISASDIWKGLATKRPVARTTVLTMVQRLEKRGWLQRFGQERASVYRATCAKEEVVGRLASGFVKEFFGGSASQLVMSLLGSKQLQPEEIARLRDVLSEAEGKK